jgi:hypothetical protein
MEMYARRRMMIAVKFRIKDQMQYFQGLVGLLLHLCKLYIWLVCQVRRMNGAR